MSRYSIAATLAILGLAHSPATASCQVRPAAQILREYDSVGYPSMSDGADPESVARFRKQIEDAAARQEELAVELLRSHPSHSRVPEVMTCRWTLLCTVSHDGRRVLEETAPCLSKKATSVALRKAASAARGRAALETDLPFEERRRLVEDAIAAAPDDESVGVCLTGLARYHTADSKVQRELVERFGSELEAREWTGPEVRRLRRLLALVGQSIDVGFPESASRGSGGLPDSTRALRGRPLLLHFASLPGADAFDREIAAIRALRERFGPDGLQIVSIHELMQDETLEGLLARLAALGFTGPQYVDAGGFDRSLLATTFHQNETPLAVLLDPEGRLTAFCFRLEPLEPLLERLLRPHRRRRPI